jgi:hypothetical protein
MGAVNRESLVTAALYTCVLVHFLSPDQQNAKYKHISYSEVRHVTGDTMRKLVAEGGGMSC